MEKIENDRRGKIKGRGVTWENQNIHFQRWMNSSSGMVSYGRGGGGVMENGSWSNVGLVFVGKRKRIKREQSMFGVPRFGPHSRIMCDLWSVKDS